MACHFTDSCFSREVFGFVSFEALRMEQSESSSVIVRCPAYGTIDRPYRILFSNAVISFKTLTPWHLIPPKLHAGAPINGTQEMRLVLLCSVPAVVGWTKLELVWCRCWSSQAWA
jgi:hypothetical protein